MKFDKNMTDVDARVLAWLTAYLWDGNLIKFSISAQIMTNNPESAEWARSLGMKLVETVNGTAAPTIKGMGLTPRLVNESKPPEEIRYRVIPYIGDVPVYLGAHGVAYISALVIDRIADNGAGYLAVTFVDNTPYLLSTLKDSALAGNGFKLSEDDALRTAGLEDYGARITKAWAILPQGLVPAYIIRYSDDAGEHIRLIDASTGEILYTSDGGVGASVAPPNTLGQGQAAVLAGASVVALATLTALLLRKLRASP